MDDDVPLVHGRIYGVIYPLQRRLAQPAHSAAYALMYLAHEQRGAIYRVIGEAVGLSVEMIRQRVTRYHYGHVLAGCDCRISLDELERFRGTPLWKLAIDEATATRLARRSRRR